MAMVRASQARGSLIVVTSPEATTLGHHQSSAGSISASALAAAASRP
jgi:hypothetical protein